MFDSFYVDCPKCGHELEFQSKSGPCALLAFRKANLPPEVAVGIDRDIIRCQYCNKRIKLECQIPRIVKVKLIVTKGKKFDYEGNYNEKHPRSIKNQKEFEKILQRKK